jgi:hypothetical protein
VESHRIKTATKGDTNLATGIYDGVRKENFKKFLAFMEFST